MQKRSLYSGVNLNSFFFFFIEKKGAEKRSHRAVHMNASRVLRLLLLVVRIRNPKARAGSGPLFSKSRIEMY